MTPQEIQALQQEAMDAWKSGDRLSNNLTMHRSRYVARKRAELEAAENKNKGSQDFRKGGMVLSTVDNRKVRG
jgi:hypothetical protein